MKKIPLILGSIVFITLLVFGIKFIKTKYFDLSAAVVDSVAITYSGTITMAHGDDFKNKKTYIEYYLNTLDGKSLKINFTSLPPENIDESQVSFSGIQSDTQIDVDPAKLKIISTNQVQKTNVPVITKKLAVILVNFQNDTNQTITPAYAKQKIFLDPASSPGAVNGYFKEVSINKFKFAGVLDPNGDVFGWYTLPITNTQITSFNQIAALSDQEATIDGFIRTNYSTIMYIFPHTTAFPADAYYVGNGLGIFMNDGGTNPEHMIHELGHSLYLSHAHSLICKDSNGNPSTLSKICTPDEYGDPFDVMGNAWRHRHFNNYYKSSRGFLPSSVIGNIQSTGLYTLYPSNIPFTSSVSFRGLEIPIESYGNTTSSYYLEYRKPYGIFDDFLSTDPVVNGISIRLKKYTVNTFGSQVFTSRDSYIIDSNPQTASFEDAPFLAGSTFNDPDRGITISVLPTTTPNPAFLQVQINITKQPWLCVKHNPLVTLNPSSQNTTISNPLNYVISVTNQDGTNCPPSVYKIDSYEPYQPQASFTNSSFTFNLQNSLMTSVLPGATQNYNVSVSRPQQNLLYEIGSHTFYIFVKDAFWNKLLMPLIGIYKIVPGPGTTSSLNK